MRVLFLTHRAPYAPNRGDRIRAFHLLHFLARFSDVHLLSLAHDEDEAREAKILSEVTASMTLVPAPAFRNRMRAAVALAGSRPLTHVLLDGPGMREALARAAQDIRPDVVVAYCSGMAQFAVTPPLSSIPFILDMVDVDSQKWSDLAERRRPPVSWIYAREARTLGAFEADASRRAHTVAVVNERERDTLASLVDGARIEVVPNGIDLPWFRPASAPGTAPVVVFCGVMNYGPNEEGARWLARQVWPKVRAARPDAELVLLGANPSQAVKSLADASHGVTVTGAVADVRPYLWKAAVAAAPLQVARGVQNKVLEALAAGLPSVITPQVDEGLPLEASAGRLVAETPDQFADAILGLLSLAPEVRRAMAGAARLEHLGWDQRLSPFSRFIEDAASRLST